MPHPVDYELVKLHLNVLPIYIDSFEKAKRKEQQALYTSDLQTSTSEGEKVLGKRPTR